MPDVERLNLARIRQLVIAGWTGRNAEAVEQHIRELEAIGVKRPKTTPIFYRAAAALLTTSDEIEVLGSHSSGEVECVLYNTGGNILVGLGSDHTDRQAEAIGVSLSKQMCAKPVSADVWRFSDVAPHWDRLLLRSYVSDGSTRRLYQEGSVAAMRPPQELCQMWCGESHLPDATAMFCGTLTVHGDIASAGTFEMELEDPVLGRKLTHAYAIRSLPDEG